MSEFNYDSMIEVIEKMIADITCNLHLPSGFLELVKNKKSHSLWIFEPVTHTKSQMIFTVFQRGKKDNRYGRIEIKTEIAERSHISEFIVYEKDPFLSYYDVDYNNVYSLLYAIVTDCAERFVPSDKFGCCGKYRECSAAGKCLHNNQFYARACWYRKNLESGRIFYK